MKRGILSVLLCVAVFSWTVGCKKEQAPPAGGKETKEAKAPAKVASSLVQDYEVIRLALAADSLEKTHQGAEALAKQALAAASSAAAEDQPILRAAALAAQKIKENKDIEAIRNTSFGDLSKEVLRYIVREEGRKKGVTAYQCPMAKGYKKWIQRDDTMANPYMGKRMLKCGGKDTLAP
jgi:hypothetical protein